MSDIEGDKPKNFLKYCKKRKLGFLAIEYSGHGKSSGKFTKGNISKWTSDAKNLIRSKTKNSKKKAKIIFIDSDTYSSANEALDFCDIVPLDSFPIAI